MTSRLSAYQVMEAPLYKTRTKFYVGFGDNYYYLPGQSLAEVLSTSPSNKVIVIVIIINVIIIVIMIIINHHINDYDHCG